MDDPNYISDSCEMANQHNTGFTDCVEAINDVEQRSREAILNRLLDRIDQLHNDLDKRMIEIDTNNNIQNGNGNGNGTVEVINNHDKGDTKIIIILNVIICILVLIILIKSFSSKCSD